MEANVEQLRKSPKSIKLGSSREWIIEPVKNKINMEMNDGK